MVQNISFLYVALIKIIWSGEMEYDLPKEVCRCLDDTCKQNHECLRYLCRDDKSGAGQVKSIRKQIESIRELSADDDCRYIIPLCNSYKKGNTQKICPFCGK